MCNMADASKGFTAEPVCSNGGQIFELFELRCSKPLAEDRKIISLDNVRDGSCDIEYNLHQYHGHYR
jgi:hypothetical protein